LGSRIAVATLPVRAVKGRLEHATSGKTYDKGATTRVTPFTIAAFLYITLASYEPARHIESGLNKGHELPPIRPRIDRKQDCVLGRMEKPHARL
jgi:hypothetical protein